MSDRLVPCPRCSRHVRVREGSCPFCLAALPDDLGRGPDPVPPPAGLNRARIVQYGALGVSAFAGAVVGTSMLASACNQGVAVLYGLPCGSADCVPYEDASAYQDSLVLADAQIIPPGGDASEDQGSSGGEASPPDAGSDAPADGRIDARTSDAPPSDAPADAPADTIVETGREGASESGAPDGSSDTGSSPPPDAPPG
jgi:hypothetical protein